MDKPVKIIVVVLIIGIIVFLGYSQIAKWHNRTLDRALDKERGACVAQLDQLKEQIAAIEEELDRMETVEIPQKKISEIFGEKSEYLSSDAKIDCKSLEAQILTFFKYLGDQAYVSPYKGQDGVRELYQEVLDAFAESPPMLSGEMEDLISLIRNVTHMYRLLGKERIGVIKNILRNEADIIESVLAIFYIYTLPAERCEKRILAVPTLEVLYQYSGYFLNTLAGRSYLLRRDSKVRVLLTYYAVLVLDRANDETLNPFGIDIRPFIDVSYYEIGNQRVLVYQKQYLVELERLREKYEM